MPFIFAGLEAERHPESVEQDKEKEAGSEIKEKEKETEGEHKDKDKEKEKETEKEKEIVSAESQIQVAPTPEQSVDYDEEEARLLEEGGTWYLYNRYTIFFYPAVAWNRSTEFTVKVISNSFLA